MAQSLETCFLYARYSCGLSTPDPVRGLSPAVPPGPNHCAICNVGGGLRLVQDRASRSFVAVGFFCIDGVRTDIPTALVQAPSVLWGRGDSKRYME
ncbi:hypothetical protein Pdw03_2532 [Penicillium digitatum]|uniref:Uncharacterized protein n=1 Tax=Penicillium digitatum TaxID=36651 RepID=A0A7T6XEJ2_PENDI|nr:hypothetical protein Pdw03_2532 [Penicillium digitatum]